MVQSTPPYAAAITAYPNQVFPNRWNGRSSKIEWPTRSSYMTPLNYFLWSYHQQRCSRIILLNCPKTKSYNYLPRHISLCRRVHSRSCVTYVTGELC